MKVILAVMCTNRPEKKLKKKQLLTRPNLRQQRAHLMRSVHLHRHNVATVSFTVLLRCPIKSMSTKST